MKSGMWNLRLCRSCLVGVLLLTCAAPDARARKYKQGDSVELTASVAIGLQPRAGQVDAADIVEMQLDVENTFDVEEVQVLDGQRWLRVRVFHKFEEKGYDRYRLLGEGWVLSGELEGTARREDSSWTGSMASDAPPAAAPATPVPPSSVKTATPAGKPPPAAPAKEARPPTQQECTDIAALFKKLGPVIQEASAVPQGGTVILTVKFADGTEDDQIRKLSAGYITLFKDYECDFRVDVMGPSNQRMYSGSKPRFNSEIQW